MIESQPAAAMLRAVDSPSIASALEDALLGGPPIGPLPTSPVERRLTLAMLALDQPMTEPDAAVVVATSGSTGHPKGVVLSRAAIRASVAATQARLGGPGDWAWVLPAHYVAGLMVLARSVIAGTRAVPVPPDLSTLPSVSARLTGRKYLSLVPTQLARALTDPRITDALATFDAVLLGGSAVDPRLLDNARERGIALVTTYGMSETCGGCVYDGSPLDGVQVRIERGSARIRLRGPMLFTGYRLRGDLTKAAFSGDAFLTQDRGRWREGRLSVTGRLDEVVVSGGVNVDLAEVELALSCWPGRAHGSEIVVVGLPDAEWGTEVVAVTDGTGTTDELRSYLRDRLPRYAAPQRLARVAVLPRTASGKVDRQRLVAELRAP